VGHVEDEHWRISRRDRFSAQSYSGPRLLIFFCSKKKPRIEERWTDYLPLRASPLKDEVAAVISQINSYVVAYFRGQLLVCLVDGILIGTALTLFGLNFAAVIGAMVVVLT